MKRIIIVMLLMSFCMQKTMCTEQFTTIYFEDNNGWKDSIFVAVGLSEEEIAAIPIYNYEEAEQAMRDSTHWVWLFRPGVYNTPSYPGQYKRVYTYIPFNGYIDNRKEIIYLPVNRMPVTISWDQQFFVENNLEGSVLSDMPAWFDVACIDVEIFEMRLAQNNSCVLHDTSERGMEWCTYLYWDDMFVKELGISIGTNKNLSQDTKNILSDIPSAIKILRDGQLLIERDGKIYTVTGQKVR